VATDRVRVKRRKEMNVRERAEQDDAYAVSDAIDVIAEIMHGPHLAA